MRLALSLTLAFALLAAAPARGGQVIPQTGRTDPFVVIVNAQMPISTLSREQVSNLFLRRTPHWPTGEAVAPVDLTEQSPLRATFTQVVHGRSLDAVRAYWRAQVFKGHQVPPTTKLSDRDVMAFVSGNKAAIGYVARSTALTGRVKPIDLID